MRKKIEKGKPYAEYVDDAVKKGHLSKAEGAHYKKMNNTYTGKIGHVKKGQMMNPSSSKAAY